MVICKKCGGTNVETIAWVNANTGEYVSAWGSSELDDEDDNWCNDCQEHVKFLEDGKD